MQSAQALALGELKNIRDSREAELERRRAELRARSDEYAAIENDLRRAGNELLRSILGGERDFDKIKNFIQNKQRAKAAVLKNLGLPEDYLDDKYNCGICRDTGFDDNGRKCRCLKELTAKYIIQNSNMTEVMKEQTFENFDFSLFSPKPDAKGRAPLDIARSAYNKAEKFADSVDEGRNILLMGGVGTGKTYLSSCIGNRALALGKTVYYETAYKLCELLESVRFGNGGDEKTEQAQSVKKYAETADLLIIDDLGTEFLTQFTAAALFDLFNARLNNRLATVISTNIDFSAMDERYSPRMTSRILGEYMIISMPEGDLRRKKYE